VCIAQVGKIVSRALKSLQSFGVVISRDAWLKEAEAAERAQPSAVLTCRCVCGVGGGGEPDHRVGGG
jgi:pre-mRNA-processing factor 6